MAEEKVVKSRCHGEGGEGSERSVIDNNEKEGFGMPLDREDIIAALAEYIELCRSEVVGKAKTRFPNLAGFCRYLGVGVEVLVEAFREAPDSYGALCAVFEDEALNSELSPTVVTAYLKQRLGYGEKQEPSRATCELPEFKLVFDHDIFEDGG